VRAQQMIKRLSSPGSLADGLAGGPMTEEEFAAWRAELVRGYATDIAGSGALPADEQPRGPPPSSTSCFPTG
jgi:hypothetical protein